MKSRLLASLRKLFISTRTGHRRSRNRDTAGGAELLEIRRLLTVGSDGWTDLTPSADSRIIYVSSSGGNDLNDGLSVSSPLKTIRFARGKIRNGSADMMLLKKGDEFIEGNIGWEISGRSSDEQVVVSSYGSGVRPKLKETSFTYWGPNQPVGAELQYVAFVGLHFQGNYSQNPSSSANSFAVLMNGSFREVTFEDNVFAGYNSGANIQISSNGVSSTNGVAFRRNAIYENASQGILLSGGSNVLFEENVFDYNGFGGSGPTVLKHNLYLKDIDNVVLKENIFSRGSNFGTKLSSDTPGGFTNFVIENNLYYNNGIGLDHSAGASGDVYTTFTHEQGSISRNVFTQAGRTFSNGSSQDLVGWLLNTKDVEWAENLFVHKPPVSSGIILNWSAEHHQSVTVRDSVVYNWHIDSGLGVSDYLEHKANLRVDGFVSINNEVNLPASSYQDPARSVGSYYGTFGGSTDPIQFMMAARLNGKAGWDSRLTADAVNDYIRAGFARKLATPVVNLPVESQTADSRLPIEWNSISGADGYEIWYANLSTGQNPAIQGNAQTNRYIPSESLPIGRYRIWVRATQNGGPASPWSQPVTLHVNSAPSLNPISGNGAARPQLSWSPLPGAVRYEVWSDNLTTGEKRVVHATSIESTNYTLVNDLGFGTYRFWVRALDAANAVTSWSVPVDHSRDSVGTNINSIDFVSSSNIIAWEPLAGAVSYELWGDNTSLGTVKAVFLSQFAATSYVLPASLAFGQYRFWVRASDSSGLSSRWSPVASGVKSVSLIGPLQPTFNRRTPFEWRAVSGAVSYELYIAGAGVQLSPAGISTTQWTPASDLPAGDLNWWVRPWSAAGVRGPWSTMGRTNIGGRATVLSALQDNSTGSVRASFTWTAVTDASRYILHVERVGNGVVILEQNLTTPSYQTSVPLPAGQYRVWVRAIDSRDNSSGIWSNRYDFSIACLDFEEREPSDLPAFGESIATERTLASPTTDPFHDLECSDRHQNGGKETNWWSHEATESSENHELMYHYRRADRDSLMTEAEADLIDRVMIGEISEVDLVR